MGRKSARPKRGRIRIEYHAPRTRRAPEHQRMPWHRTMIAPKRTPSAAIMRRRAQPKGLLAHARAALLAAIAIRQAASAETRALAHECARRVSERRPLHLAHA